VLRRRIRRILDGRRAVRIDEIRMRLGVGCATVREALGSMTARGEVVMLRPIGCGREDRDFFRLNRPRSATVMMEERLAGSHARAREQHAGRVAGLACLFD
jgi:predicted ArsR family transcriptional regulator